MKSKLEKWLYVLHSSEASSRSDCAEGKAVSHMEYSVRIWIGISRKEFPHRFDETWTPDMGPLQSRSSVPRKVSAFDVTSPNIDLHADDSTPRQWSSFAVIEIHLVIVEED